MWNEGNLKNVHVLADKGRRVRRMFSEIAGGYDRLNRILSLNLDRSWRRRALAEVSLRAGDTVVDLCCGTGDMALASLRAEPGLKRIVGVDFSQAMLALAEKKMAKERSGARGSLYKGCDIRWICADAEDLEFLAGGVDVICCGFGIRNLQRPGDVIRSLYTLLRPGGRVCFLEFDLPENVFFGWLVRAYFRLVLPLVGSMISRDTNGAYRYLPSSVETFQARKNMKTWLDEAGFKRCRMKTFFGGVVVNVMARKE